MNEQLSDTSFTITIFFLVEIKICVSNNQTVRYFGGNSYFIAHWAGKSLLC